MSLYHGCIVDILGCYVFNLQVAKRRRLGADFEEFPCRAGNACRTTICFKTTRTSAAAYASVVALYHHVAKFISKTVVAIHELTVDNDSGSYARSEGNHDEIFHAASRAVGHLSESGSVGVIGDSHGYSSESLADLLCQRNHGNPKEGLAD